MLALCVRLRGKLEAEPRKSPYHRLADGRRVLADACGEHEGVDTAHGGSEHSGEEHDPVDEIFQSQLGARIRAREQLPHVVTDPRQALEPAVIVEKALNCFRAHSFFAQQIKHNAGVELTWPRTHGQAVERREAHGAFDALALDEGAHGGAATEMRNNDAALGNFGRDLAEPPRDVLVGKAVKSVAAHPLLIEGLGDRIAVGHLGMASMKSGVEAGNL